MAQAKPSEEQQRAWGEQAQQKSLENIQRVEEELRSMRTALENREPLSLGRTKLLANLLDGISEVDGAW